MCEFGTKAGTDSFSAIDTRHDCGEHATPEEGSIILTLADPRVVDKAVTLPLPWCAIWFIHIGGS